MLHTTRFVNTVGVAPSTVTMMIPYPTVADLRGSGAGVSGLGLIQPNAWTYTGMVGRVYKNGTPSPIATQAPAYPLSRQTTTDTGIPYPQKRPVMLDGASNGLGYASTAWWQTGRTNTTNQPTNVQPLSGGLGFIPGAAVGAWSRSLSGAGQGLSGFIESSVVPNDAELSRIYGYTPVHSGWLHTSDKNQNLSGHTGLGKLGNEPFVPVDTETAKKLVEQHDRAHRLNLITTGLLAISTVMTAAMLFKRR